MFAKTIVGLLLLSLAAAKGWADEIHIHYTGNYTQKYNVDGGSISGTLIVDTQYLPSFEEGSMSYIHEDAEADHQMVSGHGDGVAQVNSDKIRVQKDVFADGRDVYYVRDAQYRLSQSNLNVSLGLQERQELYLEVFTDFLESADPRQNLTLTDAGGHIGSGYFYRSSGYSSASTMRYSNESKLYQTARFDLTSVTIETVPTSGSTTVCN